MHGYWKLWFTSVFAAAMTAVAESVVPKSAFPDAREQEVPESPLFAPIVEGGNRLINSSFELGSVGYALIVNTRYAAKEGRLPMLTIDSTDAKEGRKSLRLDLTGFHGACVFNTHACYGVPGRRLTLSCWIKANKPVGRIPCSFGDSASAQNGSNDWYDEHGDLSAGTNWTRVSFTTPRPLDEVHTRAVFKMNPPPGRVYWIDGIKVEVGDRATDYAPLFPHEAAFVGDRTVLVRKVGERATATAELRTVNYMTGEVRAEKRTYGQARYGTFKLTERYEGNWALPFLYAVVHPLGDSPLKTHPNDPGFIVGCNHAELRKALNGDAAAVVTETGPVFSRDLVPYVRLAGNGMVRIMGSGLQWIELEPERGRFDWTRLDAVVEPIVAAGMEPLLCPGGSAFMAWVDAAKDGRRRNWYVRRNSREARKHAFYNAEKNTGAKSRVPSREDWLEHLDGLLRHYAGRVTWYELVNEPNLQLGDPADYLEILLSGAKAVKAFDVRNRVVGVCATGDFGGEIAPYVEGFGALGGFDRIDVMSFHPYDAPTDVIGAGAERQLASVLALRDKFRPGLPVIEDECYFICDQWKNRGYSWRVANWPAGNLIRRLALDLAAGLAGSLPMSVTDYQDGDACHPYFAEAGGFNFSFAPSRRFVAQNFFASLFEGARNGRKTDLPTGLNGARATTADGRTVDVVWAKRETDARVLPRPADAIVYDLYGNPLAGDELYVTEEPIYIQTKGDN